MATGKKLAFVLGVVFFALSALAGEVPPPSRVAAMVSERPVTVLDLTRWLRLAGIEPEKATAQDWLDALGAAVDRAVLVESAKRENIEITDEEVTKYIESRRTGPWAEEYERRLGILGPTQEEERAWAREQLLIDGILARRLGAALFVPPAALAEWYEKNRDLLASPEVRVARVITVRADAGGPDAARARIAEVRKRALEGEDFAGLARQHSADPWAASGGLLPEMRGRDSGSVFARGVFEMKTAGEVSEVFETKAGLHVLKLEEIRPPVVPDFAETQETVRRRLIEETKAKHIPPLARELRLRTGVRVFWDRLPRGGG